MQCVAAVHRIEALLDYNLLVRGLLLLLEMFRDSQRSAVHDGERSGIACVKNCGLWVWLTDKLKYAAGKLQSYNSESDSNTTSDEWECIDYRYIGIVIGARLVSVPDHLTHSKGGERTCSRRLLIHYTMLSTNLTKTRSP